MDRTEKEQLGMRVLRILVMYTNWNWTVQQLSHQIRCEDKDSMRDAIKWLLSMGYIEKPGNYISSTIPGEQAYEIARKATDIISRKHRDPEEKIFEDIHRLEAIRRIADELHIDLMVAVNALACGQIHECRGYGRSSHLGYFLKHKGGRNKWQHICRDCHAAQKRNQRKGKKK